MEELVGVVRTKVPLLLSSDDTMDELLVVDPGRFITRAVLVGSMIHGCTSCDCGCSIGLIFWIVSMLMLLFSSIHNLLHFKIDFRMVDDFDLPSFFSSRLGIHCVSVFVCVCSATNRFLGSSFRK